MLESTQVRVTGTVYDKSVPKKIQRSHTQAYYYNQPFLGLEARWNLGYMSNTTAPRTSITMPQLVLQRQLVPNVYSLFFFCSLGSEF